MICNLLAAHRRPAPGEGQSLSARLAIGTPPHVLGCGALSPRPKAEVAEPDQEQHRPQVREQVDGQVARGPTRRDDEAPHQDPKCRSGQHVPDPPRPRRPPDERDREQHGTQEPGEQPERKGHDESQGGGRRRGDEPGRLLGQPRSHERAVEAQEQAEKHPRNGDKREPGDSEQPALWGFVVAFTLGLLAWLLGAVLLAVPFVRGPARARWVGYVLPASALWVLVGSFIIAPGGPASNLAVNLLSNLG